MGKETRNALITGASAGIGAAFAEELAKDGVGLVLTARREDRLLELTERLASKWGVEAVAIPADLSHPDAPKRLFDQVSEKGMAIDYLINNAGYGVPSYYLDSPWETHQRFMQVLVTAVIQLTYLFLDGMVKRNFGRIINVSSVAGLMPGHPGATLYAPAKAFGIRFSEALRAEFHGTNIHVTALCPGFTHTEFHDASGLRVMVSRFPPFMWMDAATVARQGIDAVNHGEVLRVTGTWNKVMVGLSKWLPHRASFTLVRKSVRPAQTSR